MLQESLRNIAKHAHARHVDIFLQQSGNRVLATIEDDGVGRKKAAEIRKSSTHKSYGLEITKGRILGLDKKNHFHYQRCPSHNP